MTISGGTVSLWPDLFYSIPIADGLQATLSGQQYGLFASAIVTSSASIPYASRGTALVQASATAIVDIASELGVSVASGANLEPYGVAPHVALDVYASAAISDLEDVRRFILTGCESLARMTGNVGIIMASGTGVAIRATVTNAAAQVRYGADVLIAGGSRATCQVSGKSTPLSNLDDLG